MTDTAHINSFLENGLISVSTEDCCINQRYTVNMQERLEKFDVIGAKAYRVHCSSYALEKAVSRQHFRLGQLLKEKSRRKVKQTYYGLLFNDSDYEVRLPEIVSLLKNPIKGIVNPIEIGYVPIINTRKFLIIFNEPKGRSLREQIAIFKENIGLVNTVYGSICNILEHLHKREIQHGNLNLDTIFFDETEGITLEECISGPCGASQELFFETPIRAQTSYKFSKDFKADYYALGLVLFSIYHNYQDMIPNIIEKKLAGGSISFLFELVLLTGDMGKTIRSLIKEPEDNNIFKSPIKLFDQTLYTTHSLAFTLFKNWELAKNLLRENALLPKNVELGTTINKAWISKISEGFDQYDFKLAAIILYLDKQPLIRIKNLSFYPSAIGQALKQPAVLDLVKSNFFSFIKEFITDETQKKACEYITHCRKFLREGFGTGSRRFIYEVLGCTAVKSNSKNIEGLYDLKSILEEIEKSTKKLSELLYDTGLISFLSFKTDYKDELVIVNSNMQQINQGNLLEIINLLAKAQSITKQKYVAICALIEDELTLRVEKIIYNNRLRELIIKTFRRISERGIINSYLRILEKYNYFHNDLLQYRTAIKKLNDLQALLKDSDYALKKVDRNKGAGVAIVVSYLLIFISFLHFIY